MKKWLQRKKYRQPQLTKGKIPLPERSAGLSQRQLWRKISRFAKRLGQRVIYMVLLMYYAYRRPQTPAWAKRTILGTLAYFISPIDILPDLTPFLGFSDDLGLLGVSLAAIAAYINTDVRQEARTQLVEWFGELDTPTLDAVDAQTKPRSEPS